MTFVMTREGWFIAIYKHKMNELSSRHPFLVSIIQMAMQCAPVYRLQYQLICCGASYFPEHKRVLHDLFCMPVFSETSMFGFLSKVNLMYVASSTSVTVANIDGNILLLC